MASRNGIHSCLVKLTRGNFWSRHCFTKCAIENKLLNQNCWSWYNFSQEKLPHTLISLNCIHILLEVCRSFFLGHPVFLIFEQLRSQLRKMDNYQDITFWNVIERRGATICMAAWIRPWTIKNEVLGSNPLAAASNNVLGQGTLFSLTLKVSHFNPSL